ncbi:MAG: DUF481 domain-containing protein [Aureibaculum sp.]|nr:DUF481 domain-containing protein [Aureibaculum sp.]
MTEHLHKYLLVFIILTGLTTSAQNDTIRLKNNDMLVGEIKSISTGILTIETSYSDKDFKIEFNKVEALSISRKCIITLTNDRRFYGKIEPENSGGLKIILEDGGSQRFQIEEIIDLVEVYDKFWKRFKGGIDLGFNFTKASNNGQFTISGNLNFIGEKWRNNANIDVLYASQDSLNDVKRVDAMVETIRLLPKKWYLLADASYLSNTEQALKGRISPSLGLGRYIKSTNRLYFGVTVGATVNFETYEDTSLNKTSSEAFLGSNFNMYDFKDFNLSTSFKFYAGLSEKGRIRTDYNITVKYDLPWDFYIKTEFTLNYDNQPAVTGTELDYIVTSGFGYKLD